MAKIAEQKHGGLCLVLFSLQFLFWLAKGDVYMHNPRGSNNRLNEQNNNRNNANRLFDSQNNNRGGYNVGNKYQSDRNTQYEMEYFMSGPKGQSSDNEGKSYLTVEWTNQHGCGDNDLNCNIVLQYKCQPQNTPSAFKLRNGYNTQSQSENGASYHLGLHERYEWYKECKTRQRNKGLFLADQNPRGDTSIYTRQNPGGTRSGYECPEERDYYPYWHPTPWKDEAIYVKRQEDCSFYERESFNERLRGKCTGKPHSRIKYDEHNNAFACSQGGGKWLEYSNFLEILPNIRTEGECKSYDRGNPNIRTRWAIPYFPGDIKHKNFDADKQLTTLKAVWNSKASCVQRRGRAGRVQEGVCFYLFTEYHFEEMAEYQQPEILRTPLEEVCLQVKSLKLGMVQPFLSKALEPPAIGTIQQAIATLMQLDAFDSNENLTPLGHHLARLPVHPRIGKIILFGAIMSCLDPVLTIASSMGYRDPYVVPLNMERQADESRRRFSQGTQSDHLALYEAFNQWESASSHGNAYQFCWDNFLSHSILLSIKNMKTQFAEHLCSIGFISTAEPNQEKANYNSNNKSLIKAVLCAGFYPNVISVYQPR
ncbi:uncharacterized protein LOC114544422 [Dendronephthya gigantea]|uniref:uncharacterized protein LOC114544422 n=1 Tax=Dendronephthya gigantea TaxID=151771 RepID=UPI00106A8042|nr:uncharacterized protein LOC114544422 [Dendronephthya gigantea]